MTLIISMSWLTWPIKPAKNRYLSVRWVAGQLLLTLDSSHHEQIQDSASLGSDRKSAGQKSHSGPSGAASIFSQVFPTASTKLLSFRSASGSYRAAKKHRSMNIASLMELSLVHLLSSDDNHYPFNFSWVTCVIENYSIKYESTPVLESVMEQTYRQKAMET